MILFRVYACIYVMLLFTNAARALSLALIGFPSDIVQMIVFFVVVVVFFGFLFGFVQIDFSFLRF